MSYHWFAERPTLNNKARSLYVVAATISLLGIGSFYKHICDEITYGMMH